MALRPILSDGLPLFNLLLYRTLLVRTLIKTQALRQHHDFTLKNFSRLQHFIGAGNNFAFRKYYRLRYN